MEVPKPDQEFLETVAEKLSLPIALLGAAGMMVALVAALVAMWHFAPGPAGTDEGPAMFQHRTQR
jgi:phosphotransferase system  glucose/maltose/N-acetylglucosamine-specific IIC component